MVVYYENKGGLLRSVTMAEHDKMTPTIPANMKTEEQISYYESIGMNFISLPYEMGGAVFNYKVCVNAKEEFMGLQPIEIK